MQHEPDHIQGKLLKLDHTLNPSTQILRPKWLRLSSSLFKSGVFVLLKFDEVNPEFGKVIEVLVVKASNITTVILSVQLYVSVGFDCHYHAFMIMSTVKYMYTLVENLQHYDVLHVRQSFASDNKQIYISLPHTY